MAQQRARVFNRQREHFARVPHRLIDDPGVGKHGLSLYVALARVAHFGTGEAEGHSRAELMRLARIGRAESFYQGRTELVDAGYVEYVEDDGRPPSYVIGDGPDPADPVAHCDTLDNGTLSQCASGTLSHTATGSRDDASSLDRDRETSTPPAVAGAPGVAIEAAAEPTPGQRANRLVRGFIDHCVATGRPRPARSVSKCITEVSAVIAAGWTDDAVKRAMVASSTLSAGALEIELGRDPVAVAQRGGRPHRPESVGDKTLAAAQRFLAAQQ